MPPECRRCGRFHIGSCIHGDTRSKPGYQEVDEVKPDLSPDRVGENPGPEEIGVVGKFEVSPHGCPTCGERVPFGAGVFVGAYDGTSRWAHRDCGAPPIRNDADVAQAKRLEVILEVGAKAERERIDDLIEEMFAAGGLGGDGRDALQNLQRKMRGDHA